MANDFLPFSTSGTANVYTNAEYVADTDQANGNQPGIAKSKLVNKALRQCSIISTVVAQFISDITGTNAVDDGTTATLLTNLKAAIFDSPIFLNRIKGDFSNVTASLRTLFQTSTTNAGTSLGLIPNGTGTSSGVLLFNSSDTLNASTISVQTSNTTNLIASAAIGTGTLLPFGIAMGGNEQVRLTTTGDFVTINNNGIGHGVGSGGTVTQSTSKGTGVTLNKQSGKITMNNAALAANTRVFFLLTNSEITVEDTISLSILGSSIGGDTYQAYISYLATGNCKIGLWNHSAGSLSEAVQIQFNIHKGATA